MTATLRSLLTLLTLAAVMCVAAVWGWKAVTKPFPSSEPAPLCVDRTVNVGTQVFRDEVAVSVFNGSTRNGLAGATMEQLEERGFVGADSDNAPAKVNGVQIWSDEPRSPAVRLVARQFKSLRKKEIESVTAVEASTFCSPPESE